MAVDATRLRRPQLMLLGSLVLSAIILFAWFPASSLLRQRSGLADVQSQLSTLHQQDAALAQEQKSLSDVAEIGRIAREQYQLVSPGQQAYEVLPPSGAAAPGTVYSGDPGLQGPVAPSAAPDIPPGGRPTPTTASDPVFPIHATPPTRDAVPASGGLLSRMVHALEFWR